MITPKVSEPKKILRAREGKGFPKRKKKELEVQLIKLEIYGLTVTQRMTTEGEKIAANLEHGVLIWFQKREPEGSQKTE